MTRCRVKDCPNRARPVPGALYCDRCHKIALAKARNPSAKVIKMGQYSDAAFKLAGYPQPPYPAAEHDWTTGRPNVTCPACEQAYHYGAPVPCTHLCPLCGTWLCWKETDEIITKRRTERKCGRCGGGVTLRAGKYGNFYGCDNWRKCKGKAAARTVEYQAPRLALAVWTPHVWTEMDDKAEDMAALYDRVEGFEAWLRKIRRVKRQKL